MPHARRAKVKHEGEVPYATFARRLNALTTDFVLVLAAAGSLIALALSVQGSAAVRVVLFVLFWALILLYEPVCVRHFGSTIGHRLFNLQVADAKTATNLGLVRAVIRFLLKGAIGWLSFLTMAFTARRQALHDVVTGSVVRIRDVKKAQPWHYVLGPAHSA
jgi:uncharacterized RDD family membrane protein YckC